MKNKHKYHHISLHHYLNISNFPNRLFPLLIAMLMAFSFFLYGCGSVRDPISKTGFFLNTVITITLYDTHKEQLLDECFSITSKYEDMLSRTKENSDVWNINHAGGEPVTVSDDTINLLKTALYYSELSQGKADLTIGAVNDLWNFTGEDAESQRLPDDDALSAALSHVDYRYISLSGNSVTVSDPEAVIDLGFIAKGFIADRIKEYLVSQGVRSAILNLGGNVLTIGSRPDGSPFRIGIQKPFADSGTTAFTLSADDISIVSSGIYERYFELEGTIYHHILDTKTGYPLQNNLLQVTILSSSSTHGDALSTVCFVLGEDKGMELIESLDDTEAVFITSNGSILSSSGVTPAQ